MKLILNISFSLSLALVLTTGHSQDTLVSITKDKLAYCISKVQQVFILNEKLLIKNAEIVDLNKKIEIRNNDAAIFSSLYESAKIQRDIQVQEVNKKDVLLKDSNSQVKSLKKQNKILKIAAVGLVVLIIDVLANKY